MTPPLEDAWGLDPRLLAWTVMDHLERDFAGQDATVNRGAHRLYRRMIASIRSRSIGTPGGNAWARSSSNFSIPPPVWTSSIVAHAVIEKRFRHPGQCREMMRLTDMLGVEAVAFGDWRLFSAV